jgi:peptidoglycan/LPS O-acetylase OafA/YrhL
LSARNHALDGLRGLAAVAVIFYHSILHLNLGLVPTTLADPLQNAPDLPSAAVKILLVLCNGHLAVIIFFVLSGFVLKKSLKRQDDPFTFILIKFAIRRAFRIYPAVIVCMIGFYALSATWYRSGLGPVPALPMPDMVSAALNAALIKIQWHGASWTLQGEVLCVPFIFAFFVVDRLFRLPGLLACFCYCLLSFEMPALFLGLPNMPVVMTAMTAGMIVEDRNISEAFSRLVPGSSLASVAFCYAALAFFGLASQMTELARTLLCAGVVGIIYNTPATGLMNGILNTRLVQFWGRTSYSLYLINVPIIIMLAVPLSTATPHIFAGVILGLGSTLLTMPLAYLSERYIERSGIGLGNNLIGLIEGLRPQASQVSQQLTERSLTRQAATALWATRHGFAKQEDSRRRTVDCMKASPATPE